MPYSSYKAIAIATANPLLAAPTGVPVASKKTDLLAGIVQNTLNVLEPPELKFIFDVLPEELLKTVVRERVSGVASVTVPRPISKRFVPSSNIA